MKRTKPSNSLPVHDYQPALQTALSWLGDRHLLAQPVNRVREPNKVFFAETTRWMPATHH